MRHDGRGRGCFLSANAAETPLSPRPQHPPSVSPVPVTLLPGARAFTRPLLLALLARVGTGARAGRERERAPEGGGRGGPASGLLSRPPTPSPSPSARAGQVSALGGDRMSGEDRVLDELSPPLDPFRGALTGARDPACGGRRGVSLSRGLFRRLCSAGSGPGRVEAWDGGIAAARQELAGRPGRGIGVGRQVGPSLGLGKVWGGDEGPDKVSAGPRKKLPGNVCWAVGRNSALGTKRPAFAPASRSGRFYSKTLGKAGRTDRARGTGDEPVRQWVALGRARCVDVAMPVLDVCCLWVF